MDKNKSIDGLTIRRSKKTTSSPKSRQTAQLSSKPKSSSAKSKTSTESNTKPKTTKTANAKSKTSSKPKTTKKSTSQRKTKAAKPVNAPIITTQDTTITQDTQSITEEPQSEPTDVNADFLKPVQSFNFDEETDELKAAEPISDDKLKPKKLKKEKKPISKKRKVITSIILVIVTLLLAAVIWFIIWGNDILAKITGGQGNIFDLFTESYEPLKTDANGRTNILAFGTSGYDMEGTEGDGTHDGAQLTDSIMVISLNQETGDLAMLSLPRDLKVSSTCTATGKINEVYWCNNMEGDNEQAGAETLTAEVGDILGVDFQYYAHLNWGSLVSIVDILGGINVTLDEDIEDYYYTGAVFEAGTPYTINGGQALGLARARHGTASGDFSRGASQQKILIGIKDKVLEKSLSLTDLLGLATTLGDNLRTNFSVDEMKTLAHLATDLDFNNIRQVSLIEPEELMTTANIGGISYVIPRGGANYYTDIQAYVAKMFSSDPRSYEDASILVLNGTDTPGLASTEQVALEEDNYHNIYIDDAPVGEYSEQYTLYDLTNSKPGTKKLLEEKYSTTAKPATELPAGIVTECDFVLILGNSNDSKSE